MLILNEKSFPLEKYEDQLKYGFEWRAYADQWLAFIVPFNPGRISKEDTYLDLYIYQTGKEIG